MPTAVDCGLPGLGKEFVYKGTGCPATCSDPDAPATCLEFDAEGCQCIGDLVLSGTECVTRDKCGCRNESTGEYYQVGLSTSAPTDSKCIFRIV